ncbi:MAG: carboxypeptidase-like regulatory domain-containing protein [Carboxylicivirga sp.]|nr:carboxypeptidase-like regulatory domain-containing protein [Carboxylicivirga sp.]
MMVQKIFGRLLFLGMLLVSQANAQEIVLKGIVINAVDQQILPYANVQLKTAPVVVNANSKGYFQLKQGSRNGHSLLVSAPGFYPLEISADSYQDLAILVIELQPCAKGMNECFLRADAYQLVQACKGTVLVDVKSNHLVDLLGGSSSQMVSKKAIMHNGLANLYKESAITNSHSNPSNSLFLFVNQ